VNKAIVKHYNFDRALESNFRLFFTKFKLKGMLI
jgi:hypothetical protein